MIKRLTILYVFVLFINAGCFALVKILFDDTKAESAANADWVIDADAHDLGFSGGTAHVGGGNESDPQQFPTPLQSTVTSATAETYWEGSLSSWGIDLVKLGYEVEELPYNGKITYGDNTNAQDLSHYKVFIVDEPNILFTTAEKTALLSFVQNGGGLFMISDHVGSDRNNDGHDSPSIWNDFMTSSNNVFGITWALNDFSQTSTNFATLPNDSLIHGPYGHPTKLQYSDGSSLKINPALNSSVVGVVYVNGCSTVGDTGVMMCHARYGSGKVVATGDSSPMDDGTGDPNDNLYNGWTGDANGNHELLIMNATIWLADTTATSVTNSLHLITAADTTICTGSTITISATGATTYSWQPGGATTASITVSPAANTMYIVTGTTGSVVKKDTVHVTVDVFANSSPQITANGPLTFCGGSSVTLSAPSESGYHWSNGSTSQNISATQAGTYNTTLTDATGCKVTTNSLTVTVDAFSTTRPQISASGPLAFCTGSSVNLSQPAGYTYQWNNAATQQTISVNQSGSFYATVTDGNNCHAQSDTATVNVNSAISGVQVTPAGPVAICTGNSVGLSAPSGYTSYAWSNGSTQQGITVSQQGSYSVIVSTGNNCSGTSNSVSVSIDNFSTTTPQITANGSLTFCQGGSVTLTASGGSAYIWSNNVQQASTMVSQAGNYNATITDANQCSAVSQALTVTVNPLPQIIFQLSQDSICSNAAPLALTASPTGGTFSGSGASGSQFNPGTAGAGSHQIIYSYTDANTCSNTASNNITVYVCTSIEEVIAAEIGVYPNPSSGAFTIRTAPNFAPEAIRVFDAMGRVVLQIINPNWGSSLLKIDMKGFTSGVYIAELVQNELVIRKRLVKAE